MSNENVITNVKGKVKFFDANKGYGFAEVVIGSEKLDVFIHNTTINMAGFRCLEQGQGVTMDISINPNNKGLESITTIPDKVVKMSALEAFAKLKQQMTIVESAC